MSRSTRRAFHALEAGILACERCPRLRQWCSHIAQAKVRRHAEDVYWGKPVHGFGDYSARLVILGLAPGAHGANRTGRVFTGDDSGRWLYEALHRFGFANQSSSERRDDGLVLTDAYISNVIRCAPPQNKPAPSEIAACADYLLDEMGLLTRKRILLCLGNVALQAYRRVLRSRGQPYRHLVFKHGLVQAIGAGEPLVCTSYHPSRQNTFTRKLTKPMWYAIFAAVRRLLEELPS